MSYIKALCRRRKSLLLLIWMSSLHRKHRGNLKHPQGDWNLWGEKTNQNTGEQFKKCIIVKLCAAKNSCGEIITIWERTSNTCSINEQIQMRYLKNTPPCCLNITLLTSSLFTESYTNTKGSEIRSFYCCSHISKEKHVSICTEQPFFQRSAFRKACRPSNEMTHTII